MTGEGKWMDAETKSLQPDTRNSSVAWVKDQWLMDFVFTFMRTANECAGWKYAIEASENIQITRYQPGDYFNWHRDGRGDHPSKYKGNNSIIGGRVRKLMMIMRVEIFNLLHMLKSNVRSLHQSIINKEQ